MSKKPLVLVDGSSYLYRAFHAMPALSNSKGVPTGATYGVINMLRKLISDHEPEYMAVIFDAKGKTFRDEIFDKYKANRKEMPNDLIPQIESIYAAINALGLPLITIPGVEADDVIGTLAKQASAKGTKTLISTSDKDLAQLVDMNVTLVNTMTDSKLDPKGVVEKFGIPPESIIDYLTLVGDTSDNIPGVPLVGPKTAVKWLQQYGTLDNIIAHAAEIKGKVGDNLRASLTQIPLSRQLTTIKLDVKLDLTADDLRRGEPDNQALIALYRELEFKAWLSQLLEKAPQEDSAKKYEGYETVCSEEQFNSWFEKLSQVDMFAFDIETSDNNYLCAAIVGIAFAVEPKKACYIPFNHDYDGAPTQLPREWALEKLKSIFENPDIKKIGQNIKADKEILATCGINLQGIAYDTMLESYIIDSASNSHDLDSLALKYLGWRTIHYEDIAGKGGKQLSFNQIPLEQAANYAAEDADITLQLHRVLWPKLSKFSGLQYVFENIERPLISVLAKIERNGVLIDPVKLNKQSFELEKRLLEVEEQACGIAGCSFNLNSPKQLQEILFGKLKLPILQKTPTGQASTADAVLQDLALDYALPRLIIEYRSLSKLITTYTKKLPEQINPISGRIHTSYNQTGAATGRLSSSDPNLQNIPIRTAEGRRIRQAFIAPKGYRIVSADYSQIELRIMAHISDDPSLLYAFERNLDIHQATAAEVMGVELEIVTSEQRRNAKAVNFGLIYGMSAFGLSKQLGIERKEAQDYIEKYFSRYPKVRTYMENTRQQAHSTGYVETLSGRRLYLPEINSSQMMRQKAAERAAINAPLQGTAADIIKLAMIKIDQWLETENIDAKMIMQVHDELVFEVGDEALPIVMQKIPELMMGALDLKVPLLVSIGAGDNWDLASEDR